MKLTDPKSSSNSVATLGKDPRHLSRPLEERIRQIKKLVGSRMFAVGIELPYGISKAELRKHIRAVPNRKRLSLEQTCTLLIELAEIRSRCRTDKIAARRRPPQHRAQAAIQQAHKLRGSQTTVWETPIAERLKTFKLARRGRLISANYRETESSSIGGQRQRRIRYSTEPFAEGVSIKVWHKRKTWSGTNSCLTVAFAPTWATDVYAKGIAVVAGMLTTHATEISPGVFYASWVEQGRGFTLKAVSGYIIRADGQIAHGKTEAAARQSIRCRSAAYKALQDQRRERTEAKLRTIRERLECGTPGEFGTITVTITHSLRAGNCESGTRHWIESHFPGRSEATIAELLTICDQKDFVLAACLQAIRCVRKGARGPSSVLSSKLEE